jgi:hypothetical protein
MGTKSREVIYGSSMGRASCAWARRWELKLSDVRSIIAHMMGQLVKQSVRRMVIHVSAYPL